MTAGTDLATVPVHKALAGMTGGAIPSLIPQTIDEVWRFSQLLANSGLTPKGIETPEQVTVQILMGFDLGLKPMQAVQNIAVINGRPAIGGDLALAILMTSGELEDHDEWIEGEGDSRVAVCRVQRKGMKPIERRFSVEDAKQAGLWQTQPVIRKSYWDKNLKQRVQSKFEEANDSPWWKYQPRMLCMRARGFAFRDRFSDVLKGMHLTEEMIGHEEEPSAPAIAGPSAPPTLPVESRPQEPAPPVQAASAPAAPPAEAEEAEIVEVSSPKPERAASGMNLPQEETELLVEAGVLKAEETEHPPLAQEEAFNFEAWMEEVRSRYAEARTPADVDDVHGSFEDIATNLPMAQRQVYEGVYDEAWARVTEAHTRPHEKPSVTGEPDDRPAADEEDDDRFPGEDSIQTSAAPEKTPGQIYLARIRAAINDPIRTQASVEGLWNATEGERKELVASGQIKKDERKALRNAIMQRGEQRVAESGSGPAAPPPPPDQPEEDEATRYDRDFRARVEACSTIDEINALSPSTLSERNKFSGHPLHATWSPLITQRRKQLTGITG